MTLTVWELSARYCRERMFLHRDWLDAFLIIKVGKCVFRRKTTGAKVPVSSHHIKDACYQHIINIGHLAWNSVCKVSLLKSYSFFLFPLPVEEVIMQCPYIRNMGLCSTPLTVEDLYKLFGILWHGIIDCFRPFVYLFSNLIIWAYTHWYLFCTLVYNSTLLFWHNLTTLTYFFHCVYVFGMRAYICMYMCWEFYNFLIL